MSAPASPLVHLEHGGARVAVSRTGGHVVSWRPALGEEMLYLSPLAAAHPGRAIRGGVPVIFPQFAGLGPLAKHGFARTADWRETTPEPGEALALELTDTPATRALWPHAFRLTLGLALGGDQLRLSLRVQNTGDDPFSFTAALHTYLRVPDVEQAALHGLIGLRYHDKTAGDREAQQEGPLQARGPVDAVFAHAPDRVVLRGAAGDRSVEVRKRGFEDLVVWNPWAEGAAAMADLPDDGFRHMLCVEAAQVARAVMLAPGEQWEGVQELAVLGH